MLHVIKKKNKKNQGEANKADKSGTSFLPRVDTENRQDPLRGVPRAPSARHAAGTAAPDDGRRPGDVHTARWPKAAGQLVRPRSP